MGRIHYRIAGVVAAAAEVGDSCRSVAEQSPWRETDGQAGESMIAAAEAAVAEACCGSWL